MLVKNFQNVFTAPDKELFKFDDDATECRDEDQKSDDEDDENKKAS